MKDRIRLLRHTLGLTQQKFADKLGIKGNAISQYESGRNAPIDAVISLICREFNVSERWLRTGEGEMTVQRSAGEEVSAFVGDALSRGEEDFRLRCLRGLARLTEEEWVLLEQLAAKIGQKKPAPEGR